MKIILLLAALSFLQAGSPVPRKAPDNSGQDSEKQQGKSPANGTAPGNSKPANNQSQPAEPEQGGQHLASPDEHKSIEMRVSPVHVHKDWADYLYIWQSMVLSFAALLTLGAIWYQARETSRAAKAARDSVGEIREQAKIMFRQTIATEKAAEAARSNVQTIIDKERARIYIEPTPFDRERTEQYRSLIAPAFGMSRLVYFTVTIRGFTDAIIIKSLAQANVTESPEHSRGDLCIGMNLPKIIEAGSKAREEWTFVLSSLAEKDVTDIREGRQFLHFYGLIRYEDVFRNEHETAFHYLWDIDAPRFGKPAEFHLPMPHWKEIDGEEANHCT
jgi:hypothetical protein